MKVLLDTSVLVAALVRSHPKHERCLPWVRRARTGDIELFLAAHSLAELHAVLTSLPVKPRISPRTAERLAEDNGLRPRPQGIATVATLQVEDYLAVVGSAVRLSLSGGVIYDALIARSAETAGVDRLITLNTKDFKRAWAGGVDRVREP